MNKRRIKRIGLYMGLGISLIVGWHVIVGFVRADVNFQVNVTESSVQASTKNSAKSLAIGEPANINGSGCLPISEYSENADTDLRLVGESEDAREAIYKMWYYEYLGQPFTVVTIDYHGMCGIAFNQYDDAMTQRVPLAIARDLNLQFYQNIIEAHGGKAQYQTLMTQSFLGEYDHGHQDDIGEDEFDGIGVITSLDKWAMDQLGITLPEGTYEVIDIDDKWEYETEQPGLAE